VSPRLHPHHYYCSSPAAAAAAAATMRAMRADAIHSFHCMRRCFHNEYIDERGLLRLGATAQHCRRLTHNYAVA